MKIESSNQTQSIERLQRLQQARLSPNLPVDPLQRLQQIAFYNQALAQIERLQEIQQLTPQQLARFFPDSELDARLAQATAPNLLDNPAAEKVRQGLAEAFREARRERARAAHSPNQQIDSDGFHTLQLADRTIRFRLEDPHWVQIEREGDSLHWNQDQVERRGPQGLERFTLAGQEPVRQTSGESVRARPDGSSLSNGQHWGPGYALPQGLESPRVQAPWWRTQEPGQEFSRQGLLALPEQLLEPLSGEQQFAPLAELQAQMSAEPAKLGMLALEERFHQRARATLTAHPASTPGGANFHDLFKGEQGAGWRAFDNIEGVLKALKLSPNSLEAKSLKEATTRLQPFFPAFDMLTSLFEVIQRVGVKKAVTILNKMTEFATNAKQSGRDSQQIYQFLSALLQDVARPSEVNQQHSPTCGTAAIQVHLAGQDPVKYVDMMTTLASGKNFKSGNMSFKPPGDWGKRPQDGRNLTAWMFQESLSKERADQKTEGTTSQDEARFVEALMGEFWNPLRIIGSQSGAQEMLQQIEDDIARGRSVSIGVTTGKNKDGQQTYHAVLVVGIDKNHKPVRYEIVSWGQRGWLTQEQLLSCITDVQAADDWGFDNDKVKDGTKKETIPAP
ncbi:hypothetical protein JST97_02940 [bacterium]|nr:hypothetical protein [bacterium]